ncbi:MAG: mechanosensitive ion channel family protein [Acidobacteriota bacterium]
MGTIRWAAWEVEGMEEIPATAREFLAVPWIQAALIFAVALVAAKVIGVLLTRTLRAVTRRTATDLDDRIVERLHRPIFVSVILIGLQLATSRLALPALFARLVVEVLQTLVIFVWLGALLTVGKLSLQAMSHSRHALGWVEPRTLPLLDNVVKVMLVAGAVYAFLVVWDLDVAPWLTSAGIVGVALGFAAKDSLANLFGGMFVIADAPYKLGDFIRLDSGERGRVTQIGLRSTRLLTREDIEIVIPNAQIASAKIVNESGGPYEKARVTVVVGVAYGSDVDRVREVLLEAASTVDIVARDPAARVRFTEFGDSALMFRLLAWVEDPANRGLCVDRLHTAVYKQLMSAGIEIPFPQRDVHLRQAPPA